jgi:threonine/homoserine/homoserine lactone efflux protein
MTHAEIVYMVGMTIIIVGLWYLVWLAGKTMDEDYEDRQAAKEKRRKKKKLKHQS